jgi:L-alanine-DL-glutamate epimerase-like enolase superfamily enzyme
MEIVRLCEESGKGYVFASMIESMLSNAVTIHLAACVRALACEAGGFYLIARDVASGLSLESGSVRVPDTPGFGVSIVGS